MIKLRVFVSSAQKELVSERMALSVLMTTDPFLQRHTIPKLWEMEPAPLTAKDAPYLDLLRVCQVCVSIIGREYGPKGPDGLSAIHREYRLARELRLPTLVCLKNVSDREKETENLLAEIKKDGHTYSRFATLDELQKKVRDRLIRHVKITYHVEPSSEEQRFAEGNVGAVSLFERQRLPNIVWKDLDRDLTRRLAAAAEETDSRKMKESEIKAILADRGYLWFDTEQQTFCATAAGTLLLAEDPTRAFVQARVQIDAYAGKAKNDKASDYAFLRGPITQVLQEAWALVRRNTRHPLRVVGLNRIELDEYPEKAFREALVNALAHRDYQDAGRKVMVEVFSDRITVSSPGKPPGNQNLQRIANGKAEPRARNPLLTQGLAWLKQMDDRGTGILRMKIAMLDHGLDEPRYRLDDGTFMVTLMGPGDNLKRLRVPESIDQGIAPSIEEQLNDRQKKMLRLLARDNHLTNRQCQRLLNVSGPTVAGDFKLFLKLHLVKQMGRGRSVFYVLDTDPNR